MSNKVDRTPHNPTRSRQGLYAMAAKYAPRAIEVLQELMEHGDNSSVRMGAAKVLLAKSIPDLKAMEMTGKDGLPMKVIVIPPELISKYEIPQNTGDSSEG